MKQADTDIIALLSQIRDAGAAAETDPLALHAILVGKTVFVDSVNGVDATGVRGDASKPFLTGRAAITAASSGDTVHFRPGTYNQTGFGKAGVTFFFEQGAICDGSEAEPEEILIFRSTTLVSPIVFGLGRFETAAGLPVIYPDPVSHHLEGRTFKQTGTGARISPIYISDSPTASNKITVVAHEEISTAATDSESAELFTLPAEAIWWRGGLMHITSPLISGRASLSYDCVPAIDGYITADRIVGRIQTASEAATAAGTGSSSAALWVVTKTFQPHSALVASTVLSLNTPNKFYLTAQKMFGSVFIGTSNGPAYITLDKWEATATAAGAVRVFAQLDSTSEIVIKGRPTLDPKAFTGASIVSSGSDVTIYGMRLVGNSGLNGLSITAGKLRLVDCLIDTSANASTSPITKSGGVLILDNCTLISGSAASITAATAQNVIVYNSRANVAKHANVTIQVGTLTVDAAVA